MDLLKQLTILSQTRQIAFNDKQWSLPEWGNALAGEVGELCNVIKKIHRGDFTLQDANEKSLIGDEAADVLIYLDLLCRKAGINLDEALVNKFNKSSDNLGLSEIKLNKQYQSLPPPLTQLEVGKKYKIIKRSNLYAFEIGDVVTIRNYDSVDGDYLAENYLGSGFVMPHQLAEITNKPPIYIQITSNDGDSYIDTIEGAQTFLESLQYEEVGETEYTFKPVQITETEYNKLPKFTGF